MANILGNDKQQVLALGRLGWPLRRIEAATGVRRETAGAYLEGGRDSRPASPASDDLRRNPASEVSIDFDGPPACLEPQPPAPASQPDSHR
jgi:hypothetical protein